ncbi:MAG: TetR/AcrR family transcriptional regulator [Pseudomonadota bacterium]
MAKPAARIGSDVRLIEAAEAELMESGGHIEMLAVAKRAGVSVGLAYHHFGSKTGLIAAVVDRFYGPLRDITFSNENPDGLDWRGREKARAREMIDYHYGHPFAPLVAGRLGREPQVLDLERDHRDALLAEGARNLRAGQRQGVVDPNLDPEMAIGMLMGGLRLAIDRAILSTPRPDRHELHEQVWRFIEGALGMNDRDQINTEGGTHVA